MTFSIVGRRGQPSLRKLTLSQPETNMNELCILLPVPVHVLVVPFAARVL